MAALRLSLNGVPTNLAVVSDRQGSFLMAVDGSGAEKTAAGFYLTGPFGQRESGSAAATDAGTHAGLGFTGAGTPTTSGGYVYLRNRWYDPQTGRFLSQDPIGLAGGVNLYAYAGNNPIAYSDPFGLCPEKAKNGMFCLDLYIRANRAAGLKGDDRGPVPNAAANRSRAQILIDPETGSATRHISESCLLWCNAPLGSDHNRVSSTKGSDGLVTVDFKLKTSVFYGLGPDIDGRVTLTPNADGTWETHGNISAFPSNSLYQMVNGRWVPVKKPHTETKPTDLIDGNGRDTW